MNFNELIKAKINALRKLLFLCLQFYVCRTDCRDQENKAFQQIPSSLNFEKKTKTKLQ